MVNGILRSKLNQIMINKPLLFLFYLLLAGNPQKVSFTVDNPSLEILMAKIEAQTEYKFAYGNDIRLDQVLSGHFSYADTDVNDVLKEISKRTPYTLQIIGDNITIARDAKPRSEP